MIKVILQQDVRGQGKRGELISVSEGYARNFLYPRKLAVEATADAINAMKIHDAAVKRQQEKEKAEAEELGKKLEGITVKLISKSGNGGKLFGAVTTQEISTAVKEQFGYEIDKRKIVIPSPIKQHGIYTLTVKLGYEVTSKLKVEVAEA